MKRLVAFALIVVIALGGFVGTANAQMGGKTIAEIVVETAGGAKPEFTTLLAAVQAADESVLKALSDPEAKLTVFAPTDAAFAALKEALGEEAFNKVLADKEQLTQILLFHALSGVVKSADVLAALEKGNGRFTARTLQGQFIDVERAENGVLINGANLKLDMVDIEASNGVIHVIDAVILPETRTLAEIVVETAGAKEGAEFTTLLAAVQAADEAVLKALSDPKAKLTVFAPTDAAFAALKKALGDEAFNKILADKPALTNILLYHVVEGIVGSDDVAKLLEENKGEVKVTMLNGKSATVKLMDGTIMIDNAKIVLTDIDAANGIIHVIDAVIVPAE
ncbi:MAG: fasciclin domain-containing protein [Anaerolineae bacterium]|nr:fasciclin domain-containing protein [Anaerolineae bacterium]MDW8298386.1 fasciclin domain-containing protein [Anaerolineae bacterium]